MLERVSIASADLLPCPDFPGSDHCLAVAKPLLFRCYSVVCPSELFPLCKFPRTIPPEFPRQVEGLNKGLDKQGIIVYSLSMAKKKGPVGYKEQLLLALELSKGVKPVALIKAGWSKTTVYDLVKSIKAGWSPDLSQAAIDAAPHSPSFKENKGAAYVAQKKVSSGGDSKENGGGDEENPEPKKTAQPASGFVSLAAIQIRSQYTPIMYMGRLASVDKLGWPETLTFEELTDIVYYHFFKDRGITLQGYIVDDEVNKPDNGKIEALQKTVDKLVKLVEAGAKEETKT